MIKLELFEAVIA